MNVSPCFAGNLKCFCHKGTWGGLPPGCIGTRRCSLLARSPGFRGEDSAGVARCGLPVGNFLPATGEQRGCRCPCRVSPGRWEQRERPCTVLSGDPPPAPFPALFLAIAGLRGKINTFPKMGQFFFFDPLFFPREAQPTARVLRGEVRVAARWPWVQTRMDRCLLPRMESGRAGPGSWEPLPRGSSWPEAPARRFGPIFWG